MKKVVVIGAGIGGLSAAALLAQKGHRVVVVEKNDKPGGRINYFEAEGFRFDMGPSWYWMPDVFENFFNRFGHTTDDFYSLTRLDPSYSVYYKDSQLNLPANYKALNKLFESIEPGSGAHLDDFLSEAAYKYKVGMEEFVWKPGKSIGEFLDLKVFKSFFRLQMLSSMSKAVSKVVKEDRLRQILEFPVLFLGATAKDTPALYSLMNYADIKLGTWYPQGGMYEIAKAFYSVAEGQGVNFAFDQEVTSFSYSKDSISAVHTSTGSSYDCDYVVANADYHHIDQVVLEPTFADYTAGYWDKRKLAPSSLLIFLGIDKKLSSIHHHSLFFDADFDGHAQQIYKDPAWPDDPLFYACCPSVTDDKVAPKGCENLFLLMPIAPDLKGSQALYDKYLSTMLARLSSQLKISLGEENILFKKYFAVPDFKSTYNAFKGNAYGLANTLSQTAILKPSLKSKKINNLFYAGQLTTPGPGLPPSIISGQVAATELLKSIK